MGECSILQHAFCRSFPCCCKTLQSLAVTFRDFDFAQIWRDARGSRLLACIRNGEGIPGRGTSVRCDATEISENENLA